MREKRDFWKIDFDPKPDSLHHKCDAFRNGDWIIFRCPICKDYERRLNWRTGEMRVRNDKPEVYHHGNYMPGEYVQVFENLN